MVHKYSSIRTGRISQKVKTGSYLCKLACTLAKPRLNSFCLSGKRIKHQVKSKGGESFAFIAKLKQNYMECMNSTQAKSEVCMKCMGLFN